LKLPSKSTSLISKVALVTFVPLAVVNAAVDKKLLSWNVSPLLKFRPLLEPSVTLIFAYSALRLSSSGLAYLLPA